MDELEHHYDIYVNEDGEMLFGLSFREKEPKSPKIVYDGGDHAIFFRSAKDRIILDNLNPEIHNNLLSVQKVIIVENKDDGMAREYEAVVKHVEKIPLSRKTAEKLNI